MWGPVRETGHQEIWSQIRFSFGYSGVLIHDEDAFVFAMMHFLLYQEKPCDLLFEIAGIVRTGLSMDHFLRYNKKWRYITHAGKMSSLVGKVFSDKQIGDENPTPRPKPKPVNLHEPGIGAQQTQSKGDGLSLFAYSMQR